MNENDKFDENEIIFDPGVILVPKGIDHVAAGTAKDCSDIQKIIVSGIYNQQGKENSDGRF